METQVSARTVSVDAERDPGPRLDPGIQTDTHTRQCVASAREWDQEEPRMLVLTLPLRKWLGDLGKIISPLWTSIFSPVKWRAWSGPADRADWKRPWRSHTPSLPGVVAGAGGTVLQRKAMKCPDHAAVSPGQANPRTSSPGYSFSALVRNCRL